MSKETIKMVSSVRRRNEECTLWASFLLRLCSIFLKKNAGSWSQVVHVVMTLSSIPPPPPHTHFFQFVNLVYFSPSQTQWEVTLWAQILLQFYSDLFETLQMFCTWSEDMLMVWAVSSFFWLVNFFSILYNEWVLCKHNSFILIYLKLCICFVVHVLIILISAFYILYINTNISCEVEK